MPLYEYQAYTAQGKPTNGLIDAPSRAVAYERVRGQGLFPSRLEEERATAAGGKASPESLAFALVQLATLMRAGIPLTEALDSLVGQLPERALQRAFSRVRVRLQEGASFAQAIGESDVFGSLLPRLLAAGERVGALDTLLEEYAFFIERAQEFRGKVVGAMVYPAVILMASLALVVFMLTHVAPTLVRIYASFHVQLPLPTRIILGVGTFLTQGGILLAAAGVLGFGAFMRSVSPVVRNGFLLRVPFIGQLHLWAQVSRWCRTVALLHKGGVPLVRALISAREVVESAVLAQQLEAVEKKVERGEALGAALRQVPLMPPLVCQMAETGEKSGQLDCLLTAAAVFFEKEADRKLAMFAKLLEPAMILIMGLVVAFIVVSVLLPIFQLNRLIR
ncbi:MAG: type II secretion system F family protein [Proteobacteria bacterium]|nr:type II secretion system F family protein [Pseudomonadota bacterium]